MKKGIRHGAVSSPFIEFFSNAQKNKTDCPNALKYNLGIGLIARMVKKGNMGIGRKYLQGIW